MRFPIFQRKDFFALFGSNIWANIVYLLSFAIIGIVLNPVEFGAFRVAQVYISVAINVAMLGLNTSIAHQLPNMGVVQQKQALALAKITVITSSIVVGLVTYFLTPVSNSAEISWLEVFYFFSFPVAVMGASIININLSKFQACGDFVNYAKLYSQWKTIVFFLAVVGSFLKYAKIALIFMAFGYAVIYFFQKREGLFDFWKAFFRNTAFGILKVLFGSGFWPYASVCVSIVYGNIEFAYVKSEDINTGVAGAYSLASLIFIGGCAFFMPLQTYVGSLIVNRKLNLKNLFGIQAVCFLAVSGVAFVAYIISSFLNQFFPAKFNSEFLDFSFLVSIKLAAWGGYAVIGSILNFINRGFEAFWLSVVCLGFVLLISAWPGSSYSLFEIVKIQIASGLILLAGCTLIVVLGWPAYKRAGGISIS